MNCDNSHHDHRGAEVDFCRCLHNSVHFHGDQVLTFAIANMEVEM